MLAGLKAGATPFRTSRHQLSVIPVTRSGCPVDDIICRKKPIACGERMTSWHGQRPGGRVH